MPLLARGIEGVGKDPPGANRLVDAMARLGRDVRRREFCERTRQHIPPHDCWIASSCVVRPGFCGRTELEGAGEAEAAAEARKAEVEKDEASKGGTSCRSILEQGQRLPILQQPALRSCDPFSPLLDRSRSKQGGVNNWQPQRQRPKRSY